MLPKVLLISDDSAAARELRGLLPPAQYGLQWYDDPQSLIGAAAEEGCDLVVISQHTPQLDPLQVLRSLRAAEISAGVIIVSRHATVGAAVSAIREGAADYLPGPCSAADIHSAIDRILQATASADRYPSEFVVQSTEGFEGMLGQCRAMCEVFDLIRRIAPADSTVLVSGESGTGKEMVVRAIHRHSRRRVCPLLACDCTALAPTLLESELFGHIKGSFSGAIATKKGLFEVAHQGTLMLDEVANLSPETQGKLLRVLETRRVRKVGDTAEREIDIRLIATTNRSLAEMVKVGAFRADLFYRLNVVPISLPPLRARPGDIPLLANAFLEQFSKRMGMDVQGFSPEAIRQMEVYPWPGNVRELRNIVERLAVLYGGSHIELYHLPSEIRDARTAATPMHLPRTWEEFKRLKRQVLDEMECGFLKAALDRSSHNITQAAEAVGMQRPNFHALLRTHGLKPDCARDQRPHVDGELP